MNVSARVSVVMTVMNEADSLPRLLDSLATQTRPPDEVIVCDGGSTDGTRALLEAEQARGRLPLRVVDRPGANISQGRNAAIAATGGEIIAVTDAGVRLEARWLEALVAPLLQPDAANGRPQAVAGWFRPDPYTPFEVAMGATVLPELRDVDPARFCPSSRSVAFTRAAWQAVGGYPEWLDYCEDLLFDFALREGYGPFAFAPDALVHFRPRSSLRAFFKQYYLYARGDGKADLFLRRHLVRYATYLLAVPLILAAGVWAGPGWLLLGLPGAAAMLWVPYRRLPAMWTGLPAAQKLQACAWVPVIRVVGDLAKMAGYPAGLWWRLRVGAPTGARKQPPR